MRARRNFVEFVEENDEFGSIVGAPGGVKKQSER
jgi:hypothetical protein